MRASDAARRLAAGQHGVLTIAQLRDLGVSRRQIQGAVSSGRLSRLHQGVLLVGQFPLPFTAEQAAVLACPGAVASHGSAAWLYGMLGHKPSPVHITVARRHVHGGPVICVHETASLHHFEIRERHGIPVTSPVRTLVDLAANCDEDDLNQAVAEAFALRLTNLTSLQRATTAYRGRRGVARLAAVLGDGGSRRVRSNPERVLLRAIRDAGLPLPETNAKLGRWEVDMVWRGAGLVVEVDAYSTHSSPFAFERDRRKDAELAATGLRIQRFTADRIRTELDAVLAWIADHLTRRADAA
jgi:very-short-patch-repair endonuclease